MGASTATTAFSEFVLANFSELFAKVGDGMKG
jgi:hypothetical protein